MIQHHYNASSDQETTTTPTDANNCVFLAKNTTVGHIRLNSKYYAQSLKFSKRIGSKRTFVIN